MKYGRLVTQIKTVRLPLDSGSKTPERGGVSSTGLEINLAVAPDEEEGAKTAKKESTQASGGKLENSSESEDQSLDNQYMTFFRTNYLLKYFWAKLESRFPTRPIQ
jgi:hypothetical protein